MPRKTGISLRWIGLVCLGLALGIAAGGCATDRSPAKPDFTPLPATLKTIAVAPLDSWTGGVKPEQVEAAFEQRVVAQLVAADRTVIGPDDWKAIWRRHADDVGGIYDASTGKPDDEKLETVREAVIRELRETRQIDAILYVTVRPSEIFGLGGMPTVCGRVTAPYWPNGWTNRRGGEKPATLVRFTCLVGVLVDSGGKELFARQAGREGIETYAAQTRALRPPEQMFQDGFVLDQVIETVLAPFAGAPGPEAEAELSEP